jgi:hypothetical protein
MDALERSDSEGYPFTENITAIKQPEKWMLLHDFEPEIQFNIKQRRSWAPLTPEERVLQIYRQQSGRTSVLSYEAFVRNLIEHYEGQARRTQILGRRREHLNSRGSQEYQRWSRVAI